MSKKKVVKAKKSFNLQKIIVAIAILVLIIAVVIVLLVKNDNDSNPQYQGNVTDIIRINGEIVSYKYNNYQFEKQDNMWFTQIQMGSQPYVIAFTYGPIYLENISMEFKDNYFQVLTKPRSKVYVTFDHDTANASYIATAAINLITNLKTVYGLNMSRACMTNSTNCAGAPVITCENTPDNAVIQFIVSNETHVLYDNNCLTIWASQDDFIKAGEKVILNWYGII